MFASGGLRVLWIVEIESGTADRSVGGSVVRYCQLQGLGSGSKELFNEQGSKRFFAAFAGGSESILYVGLCVFVTVDGLVGVGQMGLCRDEFFSHVVVVVVLEMNAQWVFFIAGRSGGEGNVEGQNFQRAGAEWGWMMIGAAVGGVEWW